MRDEEREKRRRFNRSDERGKRKRRFNERREEGGLTKGEKKEV